MGAAGFACDGYDLKLVKRREARTKRRGGILTAAASPPVHEHRWGDDERFVETYSQISGPRCTTFDWGGGTRTLYLIMGVRDVINVRATGGDSEIEEHERSPEVPKRYRRREGRRQEEVLATSSRRMAIK